MNDLLIADKARAKVGTTPLYLISAYGGGVSKDQVGNFAESVYMQMFSACKKLCISTKMLKARTMKLVFATQTMRLYVLLS